MGLGKCTTRAVRVRSEGVVVVRGDPIKHFCSCYPKQIRWQNVKGGCITHERMAAAVETTLAADLPYVLAGSALWDHLRDISIQAHDTCGEWAVSASEEDLRMHVQLFADCVFDDPAITWNEGSSSPIEVNGTMVKPRFTTVDEKNTRFIVNRSPLCGEITAVHDGAGPIGIMHTNTFVSMFQHTRLQQQHSCTEAELS